MELNPYLALLTEHHEALQALGKQPPADGNNRLKGSSEREPIKPGKIRSRSRLASCHTLAVSGGSKEGVQTEERGSGSTKTASCEETVFAGRAGEAMFKLVELKLIQDIGEKLAALIRERGEIFAGEVSSHAHHNCTCPS